MPDPLTMADGTKVTKSEEWTKKRRPEVLELFQTHVYGHSPARVPATRWEVGPADAHALGDRATRKEITIFLTGAADGPKLTLLLFVPNGAGKPVPAFLGPSFGGNQTVDADPGIALNPNWVAGNEKQGVVNHRATEASRGTGAERWPLDLILGRGYALATYYYGDVEPDYPQGWKTGLRAALSPEGAETKWKPDQWGAIGAWTYGLSRALDYLQTDPAIDGQHVAVIGHSRLGKTALWAGASDERFAMVVSNCSGEGGAALTRRNFGETTAIITKSFPHWFCPAYAGYANAADKLPIDQHELLALVAPRPLYVASASEDLWADPKGEFLAAKNAEPVYALFGKGGLGVAEQPPADHPVGDFIGYHLRTGKHDITRYDWEQYLNFADRHFGHARP